MSIVKIQRKGQMTLPTGVRKAVGLADGDLVEVKVSGKRIIVTPRSSNADDGYTPAQRRYLRARLDEAEKGPFYGPFKNGDEVAAFLKNWNSNNKSARLKKTG